MTTPLRQRLRDPEPVLATFTFAASVEIVELQALAGFEVVILDMEHGAFEIATLGPYILAARARGATPVVRTRSNDPAQIGGVLDAGAAGVIVPQVASAAEAAAVVAAARFAPEGARGANPWVRAADFTGGPEYYRRQNEETAAIVMVEGPAGIAALDEILATPGLDAIFLGPVDLSNALGVPGEPEHPRVLEAVGHAIERGQARGVAVAVFAPSSEAARRWLARGARLVAVGADTLHILAALRAVVAEVRA